MQRADNDFHNSLKKNSCYRELKQELQKTYNAMDVCFIQKELDNIKHTKKEKTSFSLYVIISLLLLLLLLLHLYSVEQNWLIENMNGICR